MTDYQTKSGRLKKKMGNEHFKPELDDDSFGFQHKEEGFTLGEMMIGGITLFAIFYVITWIFLSITPNI